VLTRLAYKSGTLAVPFITFKPENRTVGPLAGTTFYSITSNSSWNLSNDAGWMLLSQTSGQGNAKVCAEYETNTGTNRTATITATLLYTPGENTATLSQYDHCNSEAYWTTETPWHVWKYITCIYAGEYAVFPVEAGSRYNWSLCGSHGGQASYNSQLTLRNASNDEFIAFSEDDCGTGQDAFISWIADFTGNVKVVVTKHDCQALTGDCAILAYKRGDFEPPFLLLSPAYQTVGYQSGTTTFTVLSNIYWGLFSSDDWITSIEPANHAGNAMITVNYTENEGDERLGIIVGAGTAVNLTNTKILQESPILPVHALNLVQNIIVSDNTTQCYDAFQTIIVAGEGNHFEVESGGHADFIAGESIRFLPGTIVRNGGSLHAWITQNHEYCSEFAGKMDSNVYEADHSDVLHASDISTDKHLLVYPNPNTGNFTLELPDYSENNGFTLRIYNMRGECILQTALAGNTKQSIDLTGKQPGIYLIQLIDIKECIYSGKVIIQ
jgi:hypothetical protein